MAVLKRLAARIQPCCTPDEMVNGYVRLPFTRTILFVEVYSIVMMSMMFCGVPIIFRMFQRDSQSRESNAGIRSIYAANRDSLYSILRSARRRREMTRSSVERQGVKPLCFRSRSVLMRDRQMCANTLAGTDSREIPRYFVQSDSEPLPFQSGRMMASVQSAGIEQRSQMRVNQSKRRTEQKNKVQEQFSQRKI